LTLECSYSAMSVRDGGTWTTCEIEVMPFPCGFRQVAAAPKHVRRVDERHIPVGGEHRQGEASLDHPPGVRGQVGTHPHRTVAVPGDPALPPTVWTRVIVGSPRSHSGQQVANTGSPLLVGTPFARGIGDRPSGVS
jgi:hypothetical protein